MSIADYSHFVGDCRIKNTWNFGLNPRLFFVTIVPVLRNKTKHLKSSRAMLKRCLNEISTEAHRSFRARVVRGADGFVSKAGHRSALENYSNRQPKELIECSSRPSLSKSIEIDPLGGARSTRE